jgi:histidinol-phosphate aminotransferase
MPIEEVAREYGLDEIVKLASNECPEPPFPEVQAAVAAAAAGLHRYPDNEKYLLKVALGAHLGIDPAHLWVGGGSNELVLTTGIAVGGPGTSAVYAWPSFGLYRIATRVAMAEGIEVPLDSHHRHDLAAMAAAVRDDTTVVYVCNPNNPTGTWVADADLVAFIEAVPRDVMIVVDEAYIEYATAVDCSTVLPLALERGNVLVARTFSKIYGLAGARLGYMVGTPENFAELRRIQLPFSANSLAQAAAIEALRHQDRVAERARHNAAGLKVFADELGARDIPFAPSQTNFVYCRPGDDAEEFKEAMLRQGVIVRPQEDGWVRVTVGTEPENSRFFAALDAIR